MRKIILTLLTISASLMHAGSLAAHDNVIQSGEFQFLNPHAYATSQSQKNGAVFIGLFNSSATNKVSLIEVKSDVAERAEIHEMKMDGDTMKMRKIEKLELPPQEPVALEPHGYHIMLMDLKEPLIAGETFPVYLSFDNSIIKKIDVEVVKPGTKLTVHGDVNTEPYDPNSDNHNHGHDDDNHSHDDEQSHDHDHSHH